MKDIAIVWFRSDLRVHDNEALTKAIAHADQILPVYVFDERIFLGETRFGFRKTEVYRAKFIIDSVINLKDRLKKAGLDLYVRIGKPEDEIFNVAKELKSSWVFANRERTDEEEKVQDALERNLWTIGQELIYTRGKMLYYTSDLPFPITHTPDVFTNFRKEVEKFIPVREPLPTPDFNYTFLPDLELDFGCIPDLTDFNYDAKRLTERANKYKGGEDAGLKQLKYYLWDTDFASTYKTTRNELLGWDFSTKFSPYLSHGCLSPKKIYHELIRYEEERGSNESTYWIKFELLWRDFFRLVGKKYGNDIFKLNGPKDQAKPWKQNLNDFNIWADGRTGIPFIDANMKELNQTGFMSNRGRQVVASFLVNDMKIDWRMGAEYFESLLIDYDPCSNYGNWNYISGIGTDPREDRYFNVIKQAKKYDEDGQFVKFWIPSLSSIPEEFIHTPYLMPSSLNQKLKIDKDSIYQEPFLALSE